MKKVLSILSTIIFVLQVQSFSMAQQAQEHSSDTISCDYKDRTETSKQLSLIFSISRAVPEVKTKIHSILAELNYPQFAEHISPLLFCGKNPKNDGVDFELIRREVLRQLTQL